MAERFGPNKKTTKDMLGSFVNHGLTQAEAEQESVLQMYVKSHVFLKVKNAHDLLDSPALTRQLLQSEPWYCS